jgi:uncharacterized protein (TIGR02453 family)
MAFEGFGPGALGFLGDLAENNDRAWFAENRERYERDLLGPQREFVDAIGAEFARIDARVQAVPNVDRSIYRINRDIRFTPDKSPYKTYADLVFWLGSDRKFSAGYFLRLVPNAVWIGGGTHQLSDEQLRRYRHAVVSPRQGPRLEAIVGRFREHGLEVDGAALKREPAGFRAQGERAELLKFTWLHAIRKVTPPPPELVGPGFVAWCMSEFQGVKPLVDWLAEAIDGVETT